MSYKIGCFTLFDITHTGVLNRAKPDENSDPKTWTHKRNTQCNLDTVLQAISLRSQPELLTQPVKHVKKLKDFKYFGFLYDDNKEIPYWEFEFLVQHPSVFEDGISNLGYLYSDCAGIPMIICGTEHSKLSRFIDITPELRNIYFVKYENEQQ
jgi:hypothetical protein